MLETGSKTIQTKHDSQENRFHWEQSKRLKLTKDNMQNLQYIRKKIRPVNLLVVSDTIDSCNIWLKIKLIKKKITCYRIDIPDHRKNPKGI